MPRLLSCRLFVLFIHFYESFYFVCFSLIEHTSARRVKKRDNNKKEKKLYVIKGLSTCRLNCSGTDVLQQSTLKLWQVINQSTVNGILYQIIKSACRHLIFPTLVLTRKQGSLEKPCCLFIEVRGKVGVCKHGGAKHFIWICFLPESDNNNTARLNHHSCESKVRVLHKFQLTDE